MPRRNASAKILPVVIALAFHCISAPGQTASAFDKYVKSVSTGVPEARFVKASGACGLDLSKSHANYATNNGGPFMRTANFAKGVRALASDFFSTAALWIEDKQPRLIDFWSLSNNDEIDYIICVGSGGHPSSIQVTHWFYPDAPEFSAWVYERQIQLGASGAITSQTSDFKDENLLHQIKKPKMDSEGEKALTWTPGADIIHDILSQLKDIRKN